MGQGRQSSQFCFKKEPCDNLGLQPTRVRWPCSGPARRRSIGIDAHLIDVEVDMYPGANRDFITVGMPDTAVRESRERIKSALINSGFGYPNKSVTINLAPANVRKEGAGFDLPMALGILGAMGVVGPTDEHLFVGELSLDGAIRPVRGALVDRRLRARKRASRICWFPPTMPPKRRWPRECASSGCGICAKWSRCCSKPEDFTPRGRSRNPARRIATASARFSRRARAGRRPSARSKWPRPAAITC